MNANRPIDFVLVVETVRLAQDFKSRLNFSRIDFSTHDKVVLVDDRDRRS
jgi:hypothetical protein